MGSIHCYASYLRRDQDVALNAAAAGWMNQFVEVVLGGSLLIPISTAYLGLQAVQAATAGGGGFGLGFMTLPTLFEHWGALAPAAGALWFGLLFFAGITSSLAMGQPVVAFLEDEFDVKRRSAALGFGLATLLLGGFTVWLYPGGAHGEFDFWTGTFALVVFALGESLVFAWIFGMDRGWQEITRGADMRVPPVFRFVIRYVTPAFIVVIFAGSLIQPAGTWGDAIAGLLDGRGWPLAPHSVIGKLLHVGAPTDWLDAEGYVSRALVEDATRALLLLLFLGCALLVHQAWRRKRERGP
jgi:SNF family Na+-dependent transporter